jgi:hypothetical protein
MAMLVTYKMKTDKGNAITDVGVFRDPPPSGVFKSFETKMKKIYPNFDVILAHDLEIYNPHEIADMCNVLVGLYSTKDAKMGERMPPTPMPELVLPVYVTNHKQISREYMDKLLSSKKTRPTSWLISSGIPVDPDITNILSKETVDAMDSCAKCPIRLL